MQEIIPIKSRFKMAVFKYFITIRLEQLIIYEKQLHQTKFVKNLKGFVLYSPTRT